MLDLRRLGPGITILTGVVCLLAGPPSAAAQGVPDPGFSSCEFPQEAFLCPQEFSIPIHVRNDQGLPVPNALVEVAVLPVTGEIDPPGAAQSITGPGGTAEPIFPDGVDGDGRAVLQVFVNGVLVCESVEFLVIRECPVTVEGSTWGALKRRFRVL